MGCADIQGKLAGKSVFFAQHGEKQIHDFFSKYDISSRADHILGDDGIAEMDFTETPYPSLWVIRDDGEIAVLAYNQIAKLFAWSRFVTDGDFESIAVVPRGTHDEVWVVVKRNIDGSDVRYIEYFDRFEQVDQEDYHMVDCGTFLDNGTDDVSAVTAETVNTITGITQADPAVVTSVAHGHSNGNTVRIGDVVGMIEVNGQEFTVANKTDDTFELSGIDSSAYTAYVSGGKEVKTPNIGVTMDTALATLGWANDDYIVFRDLGGMTELNNRRFKIEGVSGSTFDVDTLDTDDYTAYTSGGTVEKVVNSVDSLTHLDGETAAVTADGGVHADEEVSSNEITLDSYFNRVHVGLSYTATLKTLRVESGAIIKKKRIARVRMRLYRSLGIYIGPDEDNLEEVLFQDADDVMGQTPELYTGDKEIHYPGEWGTEIYIYVEDSDPTPLTVLALGAVMVIRS